VAISSLHRGFDAGAFLPEDLSAAVRRRLHEICGLALVAAAALATAALASWSVMDPSFSTATGAPVRNLLGAHGAVAADLLMQLFGLAAIALVLPVALWGWRLMTHRRLDRLRLRLALWLGGALLAAGFIACLTRPHTWPLPTGLGGVIGDTMLRLPAWFAGGALSGMPRLVIALVLGCAAFVLIVTACGVGLHAPIDDADPGDEDEADENEGAIEIALGWIGHQVLSFRSAVARRVASLFTRGRATPAGRGAPKARVEPRIVPPLNPQPAPDEEEDAEEQPRGSLKVTQSKPARNAAKPAARKSSSGYELPALGLLMAPKAQERFAPSMEALQERGPGPSSRSMSSSRRRASSRRG
jgi:S-DNA-T family DNA segregation ATPase FtsK/SpoIIIE